MSGKAFSDKKGTSNSWCVGLGNFSKQQPIIFLYFFYQQVWLTQEMTLRKWHYWALFTLLIDSFHYRWHIPKAIGRDKYTHYIWYPFCRLSISSKEVYSPQTHSDCHLVPFTTKNVINPLPSCLHCSSITIPLVISAHCVINVALHSSDQLHLQ